MDPCITRLCGLQSLVDRTQWGEYMFICLRGRQKDQVAEEYLMCQYDECTLKGTFRGILWVIFTLRVYKNRPLIPGNLHLTALQCCLDSASPHVDVGQNAGTKQLGKNPLRIRPSNPCKAKKGASPLVIETTINLDILPYRWNKGLSRRNNPIKDHPFQPLCIVSPSWGQPFLKLGRRWVNFERIKPDIN